MRALTVALRVAIRESYVSWTSKRPMTMLIGTACYIFWREWALGVAGVVESKLASPLFTFQFYLTTPPPDFLVVLGD